MIRALYHAFKLYIKIHGETFCCLTFLGEKNFDQHFPDLGRLEATLQKHHSCFSQQHLQKSYCCQSVKSCTLNTLPLLQSLQTGTYNTIHIIYLHNN